MIFLLFGLKLVKVLKMNTIFVGMRQWIYLLFLFFYSLFCSAQNIKSIVLRPLQEDQFSAIVPLGTLLELSFDDLDADSKDYRYRIEHMDHRWEKSRLLPSQYIDGFQEMLINNVENSFNTFQGYSHYKVRIPNRNTVITKSGNYLLSVLNDYDEVVFTRRFVYYEDQTTVSVKVSRSRNAQTINSQQTIEFSINHPNLRINNPSQEVNVVVIKNENWNETLRDLQPTFFKSNQLQYNYSTKTNFWGGNEYFNFDTKLIRNRSLNILKIERKEVFHLYLYPFEYNPFRSYSYNPDINGQFIIRTLEGNNSDTEGDYAMMHFSISDAAALANKEVYVYGAFNNFELEESNKMMYNPKREQFDAEILLKQGFYNYSFATKDKEGNINLNEINGSFFQTENEYKVLVYYKAIGALYDRVVGIGMSTFSADR